jgi:hypothetical protein
MKTQYSHWLIVTATLLFGFAITFTSCTKEDLPVRQVPKGNPGNQVQATVASSASLSRSPYFPYGVSGPYVIQSMAHPKLNLVLDVPNGSSQIGLIIQQYPYNGGDNQKWWVTNGNDGFYRIQNCASGKTLDLPNGSMALGVKIQQYWMNFGSNQDWVIDITSRPPIIAGSSDNVAFAMIRNRVSGLALTVPKGSTTPGTQIEQWLPLDQTWRFVRLTYANDTYVPY